MRLTLRVPALVALALFLLGVVTVEVGRSGPVTTTVAAEADSFVDSSKSTTNYGASSRIRLDSSPIERGYLRFTVPALGGSVTRATLRVFSNATSATGYEVHQVPTSGWGESTITYANAPVFSAAVVGTSGAISNGRWSSVDVSSAVTAAGLVSFALTTSSSREISLSSRETGANAPQLVVEVNDTTAPSVTLTSPAGGSSTDPTPTFSGVAGTASGDSPTVTVNVYAGASATGTPVQTRTATAAANGSFSVAASPALAPGTYTARATQSDAGGNTGFSAPTTFNVIDSVPPVITLTSPANGAATSDATPTFAGVAGTATGDSSSVVVDVYPGTSATGTPVAQPIATVGSGGAYSVDAAPPLAEGVYTARARQSDAAGNTGFSQPATFTVDTTPPTVTLTDPADGSSLATSTPTFHGVAGTAAGDSSSVTVKVYAGSTAGGTPVQTLTTTAGGGGAYAVTAAALANGTYTARAEQRDAAGNTGSSSANTFTVTVTVTDQVLLAAGDIADCGLSGDEATAALVNAIPGATVATLGDNVYDYGTLTAYNTCYDPSWGAFKNRTRPVLGGHDYPAPNETGYVTYFADQLAPFGPAASDPTRGWYSYDLGAWHIAVVNAACGGTDAPACSEAAQESWLRTDLAASSSSCQMVMWHNARWSSGAIHGNDVRMQKYWQAAYDAGVDVVLVGHEHDYERFAPQDAAGQADAQYGVREFVVGTGGESHYGTGTVQPNSEVRNNDTFGVLKLTLRGSGYDWQFIPEAGHTFSDSGSGSCHPAPPPPPAAVPSVRAVSSNAGNALTSITIGTPAGTTAGDLLVAIVAHQGGSGRGMTPPAGWTAIPNTDVYEGTNARIHAWFKFAGSSEPSSYTFTLSGTSGQDTAGGIVAVSGANAAAPINASAGQSNGSIASTSVQAPSVTTTVPNALLFYAGALNVAATWTQPPFMTEQFERATSGTYKVSIESATQPLTAAGATGTRTATLSTSGRSVGITFAIAPSS